MSEWLAGLFRTDAFLPHGNSFLWRSDLLWLEVASDGFIALSYFTIPFALLYFARRRRDFGFRPFILLFCGFILACGLTHVLGMVVIWHPVYWLEGWIKAVTALLSITAAIVLWPLMPKALRVPSPASLQRANLELETHIREREKAEEALRQANITLELNVRERTQELSQANARLQNEIDERNRVGEALRHSELLLRQFNEDLERYVDERTAELTATIQELESFTYTVSHDLRAPLRAINGYAEILREEHASEVDEEGRELLAKIANNSVRMAQLIDGLLDFSRLGRIDRGSAEVDMHALATSVAHELQAGVPGKAGAVANIEITQLPPVTGDAEMLRQVWYQLISNALKFSTHRERPTIRIAGWEEGSEVVYAVHDNGVGFDMQFGDKLFGVFQRLHSPEEFPGVGVGLAIVRRIVERHGGRVWARGTPNQGASFFFALKRAER